jgi:dTMP kinase
LPSAKYEVLIYDFSVSPHSHRGRFITFEGLDGCGKSTQLEKLAEVFRTQGLSVVVTREPGGTATGEKIRRLLLDTATVDLAPMAELALMFASRAQHIAEVIQPALAEGRIVLCDRFTDSTEAYQGGGRRLGSQPVLTLHHVLCGDLQPDLTILMDSRPPPKQNAFCPEWAWQERRESLRAGEQGIFRTRTQRLHGHRRPGAAAGRDCRCARSGAGNPRQDHRDCPAQVEAGEDSVGQTSALSRKLSAEHLAIGNRTARFC